MKTQKVATKTNYEHLTSQGFSRAEIRRLIHLKLHLQERTEYREKMVELNRLNFARWLVEHDRLGI